ncbi:hypothetical protein [Paraburkholderia caribensis]|uniref:hypothetical protein n=1 Tax=Paraburkholderia caribensis TaxID=75105 RepID=UPI0034D20005
MKSQHSGRQLPDREVDGQVRLLTLLVALHLLVFSESRTWLSPAQSVGVMRRWHIADSTVLDVLRRVRISSRALPIAVRLTECHGCLLDPVGIRAIFDSGGSIDADAVLYRIIRRACESALLRDSP